MSEVTWSPTPTPASTGTTLTAAQVATYIAELQAILSVASIAASFSPNKSTLQLITTIQGYLTEVKTLVSNPAFLVVLNSILGLLQSGNVTAVLQALEAALGVAPAATA